MKLTLLMGAGTIFAAANLRGYGVYWAQAVCADAGNLCDHSWYFVIAGLCTTAALLIKQELTT